MCRYFDEEADIGDVLVCTHSLALARVLTMGVPRVPWCESTYLIWTLVRGRTGALWWPLHESLGLFLVLRSSSVMGLNLSSIVYAEETRAGLEQILVARSVELARQRTLIRSGCRCLSCELAWLANGWLCPWARF